MQESEAATRTAAHARPVPRTERAVLLYVTIALLLFAIAFAVVIPAFGLVLDLLGVALVVAIIGVAVLLLAVLVDARVNDAAVQGVLVALSPWLPGAVAVVLVALVLLDQPPVFTVVFALVTSTFAWLGLGFAFSSSATVATANSRSYAELRDRLHRLQNELAVLRTEERFAHDASGATHLERTALRELHQLIPEIAAELGAGGGTPRSGSVYVGGSGYITLWNRIHRAEEALIALAPAAGVVADAAHDRLRLEDSRMQDAKKLTAMLDRAVATLEKERASADVEAQARVELTIVRRAIDQYRDDLWDRLVRAKGQLLRTMVLTGLTADGGLILAVLAGVDTAAIVGASSFYLVGATVGLFARLRAESSSVSAVDDYGLGNARLSVTALVSGLAALFGVALMAKVLLPTADVVSPATVDDTGKVTVVASGMREPATLHDIFDLDRNPGGLLIAAVFGLTPGLVLDRLKDQADQYKRDIQSSGITATADTKKPGAD